MPFNVTGVVHHWAMIDGRSSDSAYASPVYLGTSEVCPKVKLRRLYSDVRNDIAGEQSPAQKTRQGLHAMVASLMNYFNHPVASALKAPNLVLDPLPGIESSWSRGTLSFGVDTFQLWLVFENYWNGTTFKTDGLLPGYYFPRVQLLDYDEDSIGTRDEKALFMFQAFPRRNSDHSWTTYGQAETDFPATVRVPQ